MIQEEFDKEKMEQIKSEKIKTIILETIPGFLSNIEILEYIGSGSESEVYKVLIKYTKKFVALKFIFSSENKMINNPEINFSSKLKHKNIINFYVYDEIKRNELYCMIMEHGKFGNMFNFLNKCIQRNYFSETILCFFSYQILQGIQHCHKNKICHMDIKPQNIVIDEHLIPKLIDFSISFDYSNLNNISNAKIKLPFVGTSLFMSPEIILQKYILIKDINKIDLYSFGVTLYLLGYGHYPYSFGIDDVKNYNNIIKKINSGLNLNKERRIFSSAFIDFLLKLLESNINKRINIEQALNHYWIKGADILMQEKEKINNRNNFLAYLIMDHFHTFEEYLKNYKN